MTPSLVALSWTDASTDETGFRVERRPPGSGSFASLGSVAAGSTAFVDTNVIPDQQWQYRVFAFNAVGDSPPSNVLQVQLVPAAPASLAAKQTAPDEVSLTWDDLSSSETGFRIERRVAGGGTFAQVGLVAAGVGTFVDRGAPPASTLDWRVLALNGSGASAPSNTVTLTLPAAAPVLVGLSRRFALEAGGVQVTLTGRYFSQPGAGATTVTFGGRTAASVVVVDAGTITCTIPSNDPAAGPFVDVTVQNALGSSTLPLAFTYATGLLEEDFSGGMLPAWLEDPSGTHVIQGGVISQPGSGGDSNRRYVRTTTSDWLTRDFVFEVSLNFPAAAGNILFPGVGSAVPDGSFSNEPQESFYLRHHPPAIQRGHTEVVAHSTGSFVFTAQALIGHQPNTGTRRIRITKVGQRITFALDSEWAPGQAFAEDMFAALDDVSASAPFLTALNSHLFFGGAQGSASYDDVIAATLRGSAVRVDSVLKSDGDVAGGQAVAIAGASFQDGSTPTVRFGDGATGLVAGGVSVVHAGQITAQTPVSTRSGRTNVVVTNTTGTGVGVGVWRYHRAFFSAPLEGTGLDPDLESVQGGFAVYGGAARPSGNRREYVRTIDADYHGRDFVFDVDLTTSHSETIYIGLGAGEPTTLGGEPHHSIYLVIRSPDRSGGRVSVTSTSGHATADVGTIPAVGRHLVRLTRRLDRLDLEIDVDWPGVGFTPDLTHTVQTLSRAAPYLAAGQSRLFVSASNPNARLDAWSVKSSPSPAEPYLARGHGEALFSWQPVANATSYTVYRGTSPGVGPGVPGALATPGATSPLLVSSLSPGVTYYFTVTATVGGQESPVSGEVSVTPLAVVVGAPGAARALPVSFLSINDLRIDRLRWRAYALDEATNELVVIDLIGETQLARIPLANGTRMLSLSPNHRWLAVVCDPPSAGPGSNGDLYLFDPEALTQIAHHRSVAVDAFDVEVFDDARVWMSSTNNGNLAVYEARSGQGLGGYSGNPSRSLVTRTPDQQRIYAIHLFGAPPQIYGWQIPPGPFQSLVGADATLAPAGTPMGTDIAINADGTRLLTSGGALLSIGSSGGAATISGPIHTFAEACNARGAAASAGLFYGLDNGTGEVIRYDLTGLTSTRHPGYPAATLGQPRHLERGPGGRLYAFTTSQLIVVFAEP